LGSVAAVEHYDLVIIGSGSGNSIPSPDFADWRIAIVDEGVFGGTCINVGCVPTKMFVYAADIADTIQDAHRYGLDATLSGVRWADIRDRIFGRIDPISAGGRAYRRNGANTTLYEMHAEFVGPRVLRLANGEEITGDHIVLATGTRATVPPELARSDVPFHTSDTIMRIDDVPKRLVILGGGYIAAEFAHIFGSLGSDVTIVSKYDRLIRELDDEIATRFTRLAAKRWTLHLGGKPTEVGRQDSEVLLTLPDGTVVAGDLLLVAAGRIPNSDRLNPAAAGVDLHPDGRIVTDRWLRTSAAGVWALGDARSERQLKHVANADSRIVAHNLRHPDRLLAAEDRNIPAAVFTNPQIATVGLTEQAARDEGYDVVTSLVPYGVTAYGWALEDTTSVCKLVADRRSGRLLGGHILGPHASTLIQPVIQALAFGSRPYEVARGQYWIHPALAEVVENAMLALGV
jgi:mycothione reductase